MFEFQRMATAASSAHHAREMMEEFSYNKWPDDPTAKWKGDRLLAAHLWVLRHHQELDVRPVGLIGAGQIFITRELAGALYRIWAAVPDQKLGGDPEVAWVIELAREEVRFHDPSA